MNQQGKTLTPNQKINWDQFSPEEQNFLLDLTGLPRSTFEQNKVERIITVSPASHNDWDWTGTFKEYYQQPCTPNYTNDVERVFSEAFRLMNQDSNPLPFYSICEIAFLKVFYEKHPCVFSQHRGTIRKRLRIVGGGMTSPSNLQPHGETFIRDYLLGSQWVARNLGLPVHQAWVPDDFGHDPQLPVVLQAMGLNGVGFSRIPGGGDQWGKPPPGQPGSPAGELYANGLDFKWQASNGSEVLAHWMAGSYSLGKELVSNGDLKSLLNSNSYLLESSPTPLIYMPVSDDMLVPTKHLITAVSNWNTNVFGKDGEYSGIYAVIATFDHYVQWLNFQKEHLKSGTPSPSPQSPNEFPFIPTPYCTGAVGSRPLMKQLHAKATQALLGAETFISILHAWAQPMSSSSPNTSVPKSEQALAERRLTALNEAWGSLAPSNHHAYITGLSNYYVTFSEQIPLLRLAAASSQALRDDAMTQIADAISPTTPAGPGDQTAIAVFNQLGFERDKQLVELDYSPEIANVVDLDKTERAADGKLLFMAGAKSLSYKSYPLSVLTTAPQETVKVSWDAGNLMLRNSKMSVIIDVYAGSSVSPTFGAITAISTIAPDGSMHPLPLNGEAANELVFYPESADDRSGGPFSYAFEPNLGESNWEISNSKQFGEVILSPTLTGSQKVEIKSASYKLLEGSFGKPCLRVSVVCECTYSVNSKNYTYWREYTLVAGEPFLRCATTGDAPPGFSVMSLFPVAPGTIESVVYGTPNHWMREQPIPAWKPWHWDGPFFKASHHFFAAEANMRMCGAIYQSAVLSWAAWQKKIVGTLFRNPTMKNIPLESANGTPLNSGPTRASYAFRVPETGGSLPVDQALREAMCFHTPLRAKAFTYPATAVPFHKTLPAEYSLAAVAATDGGPYQPMIVAAKQGAASLDAAKQIHISVATAKDLILRIYHPGITPDTPTRPVRVTLGRLSKDGRYAPAKQVTALETDIPDKAPLPLKEVSDNTQTFDADVGTLTTFKVSPEQSRK